MNEEEAVMRRVRALLALAKSPNENEAAAAAAKANELMALYNLDLSRSGTKSTRKATKLNGGLYKWQRDLWQQVAALNFCMYECEKGLTKGSKYEHTLLGREVNVASARVLAEYLEEAIGRLAGEYAKRNGLNYFSKDMNAYKEGMASTLQHKLWQKRWAMQREEEERNKANPPSDGRALVVTLSSMAQEEEWANIDAKWGYEEGTTKRKTLEARARWAAREAAAKEADELLKMTDPLGYAAKEAEAKAKRDANNAAWEKKQARRAKRPRKEKPVPDSYYDGQSDGERISLDQQIDETKVKGYLA